MRGRSLIPHASERWSLDSWHLHTLSLTLCADGAVESINSAIGQLMPDAEDSAGILSADGQVLHLRDLECGSRRLDFEGAVL